MKKILLTASIFLLSAFTACTNENEDAWKSENSLTVHAEVKMESRTMLGADAQTVTWCEGDQIYIFDKDGSSKGTFALKSGAGERTGTFAGNVDGQFSALDKSLYPVPTAEDSGFSFEFPSVREYAKNSTAPMIGDFSAVTKHVGFRNLAALVRVSLVGQNLKEKNSLTLAMNGQNITGKAVVDLDNETLTLVDGGNTLTINNIPASASYVDVPVPAGSYAGYTVTLNGEELKSSTNEGVLTKDNTLVIGENDPVYFGFYGDEKDSFGPDYVVLGSGEFGYLYNFYESAPQLPKRLVVIDKNASVEEDQLKLQMNFNEDGLPSSIVSKDFTIVLGKHSGNKFNAFVILTDGQSMLLEDLELDDDYTWEKYLQELNLGDGTRAASRNPILGPVNTIASFVGCGLSIGFTIAGAPTGVLAAVGWGLTAISCTSDILTIGNNLSWWDTSSIPSNVMSIIGTVGACVPTASFNPWDCATSVIGTVIALADDYFSQRQDDIQLGNGALATGNGEVKLTLTWDNVSDIDLHCVDPSGAHIYYANMTSPTGGFLDSDNVEGPPVNSASENIYFASPAPSGQYEVYLHYYASRSGVTSVNYKVLVMKNGVGETFTGTISGVKTSVPITTFVMGAASRATTPFRAVTWDWNKLPAKN